MTGDGKAMRPLDDEVLMHLFARLADRFPPERWPLDDRERLERQLRPTVIGLLQEADKGYTTQNVDQYVPELVNYERTGPLARLKADPTIEQVLVLGHDSVMVVRHGRRERAPLAFRDRDHLRRVIGRLLATAVPPVDAQGRLAEFRTLDGARVQLIRGSLLAGDADDLLSIWRRHPQSLSLAESQRQRTLAPEMAVFLERAVRACIPMLIVGSGGSGKTTLLSGLAALIPESRFIVAVEDFAEVALPQPLVRRLQTFLPAHGGGDAALLCRAALGLHPDHLVIGEIRGAEAFDLVQVMHAGSVGLLATLNAATLLAGLGRLAELAHRAADGACSHGVLRRQLLEAGPLLVGMGRQRGGPIRVQVIAEIAEFTADSIALRDVFVYRALGVGGGQFEATGNLPAAVDRCADAGLELPAEFFAKRVVLADPPNAH